MKLGKGRAAAKSEQKHDQEIENHYDGDGRSSHVDPHRAGVCHRVRLPASPRTSSKPWSDTGWLSRCRQAANAPPRTGMSLPLRQIDVSGVGNLRGCGGLTDLRGRPRGRSREHPTRTRASRTPGKTSEARRSHHSSSPTARRSR